MKECDRCKAQGIRYRRSYEASEFLEGYADSPIWIVGVNPAAPPEWEDGRSVEQLQTTFYETARKTQYFRDFGRVSPWLFSLLEAPGGVAHTDLVKCSSKSWPLLMSGPRSGINNKQFKVELQNAYYPLAPQVFQDNIF